MKTFLFYIICIFVIGLNSVIGQTIKLRQGPEIGYRTILVDNDGKNTYLWHHHFGNGKDFKKHSAFQLDILDENFEKKDSFIYKIEGEDWQTDNIFKFNDKFICILTVYDNSKDTKIYKALSIDMNGKGSIPVIIGNLDVKDSSVDAITEINYSQSNEKFVFTAMDTRRLDRLDSKDKFKFLISLRDKELNEIYSRNVMLNETEKQIAYLGNSCNSKNEVSILCKVFEEKIKYGKTKTIKSALKIFQLASESSQIKEIDLQIKDKFVVSAGIKYLNDSIIYCVGHYSNHLNGVEDGVFFIKIQNGVIISENLKLLTNEQNELLGKKPNKESIERPEQTKQINYANFIINSDNSTIVTCEKIFTTSTIISFIKINENGSINSINMIPRDEYYREYTGTGSHSMFKMGEKSVFFYNTEKADFMPTKKASFKLQNAKTIFDMVPALSIINSKGEIVKKTIFPLTEKRELLTYPRQIKQIDQNKFLISIVDFNANKYSPPMFLTEVTIIE